MITPNDLTTLGHRAVGMTGADVEAVVTRARAAARRAKRPLALADVHTALDDLQGAQANVTDDMLALACLRGAATAVVGHVQGDHVVRAMVLRGGGVHLDLHLCDLDGTPLPDSAARQFSPGGSVLAYTRAVERRMVVRAAPRAAEVRLHDERTVAHAMTMGSADPSDLDLITMLAMQLALSEGYDGYEPMGYGPPDFTLLHRVSGLHADVMSRVRTAREQAERVVATFEPTIRTLADVVRDERVLDAERVETILTE